MRSYLLPLLYVAFNLISVSHAADCKPSIISLPFDRTVLANGAEARGVSWEIGGGQIGGPNAQTIVLLPSASFNDTYLYGAKGLCAANLSTEECTTYRGGIYNFTQSDTAQPVGGEPIKHVFDNVTASWRTDTVSLNDDITGSAIDVKTHIFGVRDGTSHPFVNQGELGLGWDSTLLDRLSAGTKKITSRSYAFFWGMDAAVEDKPRRGSLTLGGYDRGLIADGPNTTTSFNRTQGRCREGMMVDLTGMTLQSPNGSTQTIMDKSEKLQVCIVPTLSSVVTLPEQIWDRLASGMGIESSSLNNGQSEELFYQVALIKPESATFTGNLSITINEALTVTISNKQLIFDEPYIGSNGLILHDTSRKVIPIRHITAKDAGMSALGGMFFSSAYLMVNHDEDEFTIAAVKKDSKEQKWIGIDTSKNCEGVVESGSKSVFQNSSSNVGLSGGVIAGIVVGSIAGVTILAGVILLLWRRKRRTARLMTPITPGAEHGATRDGFQELKKFGPTVSELYAHHQAREFAGHERDYALELDSSTRPTEVHGWEAGRDGMINELR